MKDIPSSRTEVKELQQEKAIFGLEVWIVELNCRQNYNRGFSRQNCSEVTADLGV